MNYLETIAEEKTDDLFDLIERVTGDGYNMNHFLSWYEESGWDIALDELYDIVDGYVDYCWLVGV